MLRPIIQHEAPRSWRSLLALRTGSGINPTPLQLRARPRRHLPRVQVNANLQRSNSQRIAPDEYQRLSTALAAGPDSNGTIDHVDVDPFPTTNHAGSPTEDALFMERAQETPESEDTNRLLAQLLDALHANDSEALVHLAVRAFNNDHLMASVSSTTITQVLDSVQLNELLAKHKELAERLTPEMIRVARDAGWRVRSVSEVLEHFHSAVEKLVTAWLAHGRVLDLPMCKSFLRISSSAGNAMGARVLRKLAREQMVEWDTEAYNLYLDAICWQNAFDSTTSPSGPESLRVTAQSLSFRRPEVRRPPGAYAGSYTTEIKNEAIDAFEEMAAKGYAADTHTFTLLMLAMARVGDIEGVEATLHRVWGIDVAQVMANDASSLYFENDMQPSSLLYPTPHLLYTVVHIYGSNNALVKALQVVDFIAQKYSITIDDRTWTELARWNFILSTPRRGTQTTSERNRQRQETLAVGLVPQASFKNLIRIMSSPPYNVVPNLMMYDWLFRTYARRGELAKMRSLLRFVQRTRSIATPGVRFRDASGRTLRSLPPSGRTEIEDLEVLANSAMFLRWLRLSLVQNAFRARAKGSSLIWYSYRFVPDIIAEWGNLWFRNTHRAFHYQLSVGALSSGQVTFHRRLQDANPSTVEVFAGKDRGRYIVRPRAPSLAFSFQEKPWSERREQQRARKIAEGQNLNASFSYPIHWSEQPDVQDWVWLAPRQGLRIPWGRFGPNSRRLVLPARSLEGLDKAQIWELRRRAEADEMVLLAE